MATITEDYVSFETAKLLKKKEFNELAYKYYTDKGSFQWVDARWHIEGSRNSCLSIPSEERFIAPTLQMAMKWLRKAHNLFVFPFPQMNTNKFWAEIYQLSDNQKWENLYCESINLQDYPNYEEACEAAIKYCLEHLI